MDSAHGKNVVSGFDKFSNFIYNGIPGFRGRKGYPAYGRRFVTLPEGRDDDAIHDYIDVT